MKVGILQHTPAMQHEVVSGWKIHEGLLELDEGSALERFGQEIGYHVLCGTVLHGQITIGNVVSDKEVAHIEMSCTLRTQQSAILFKEDGTLVVLMKDGLFKFETLSMKKIVCPK